MIGPGLGPNEPDSSAPPSSWNSEFAGVTPLVRFLQVPFALKLDPQKPSGTEGCQVQCSPPPAGLACVFFVETKLPLRAMTGPASGPGASWEGEPGVFLLNR